MKYIFYFSLCFNIVLILEFLFYLSISNILCTNLSSISLEFINKSIIDASILYRVYIGAFNNKNNAIKLKIRFDLGLEDGKSKTRSRTYSNIRTTSTSQDLFDVANSIANLQTYDVLEIIKQDYTSLNE